MDSTYQCQENILIISKLIKHTKYCLSIKKKTITYATVFFDDQAQPLKTVSFNRSPAVSLKKIPNNNI